MSDEQTTPSRHLLIIAPPGTTVSLVINKYVPGPLIADFDAVVSTDHDRPFSAGPLFGMPVLNVEPSSAFHQVIDPLASRPINLDDLRRAWNSGSPHGEEQEQAHEQEG